MSQTAANRLDAAGGDGNHQHEACQRQRRKNMRAFITAGARQEPGQQNRGDQPGKSRDLDRRRRTAHRQINRKRRQRHQAAEQPWRHERTMARTHQRIISYRGMQQRIETIARYSKTITALALRLVRRTDAPERPHYLIRPPCQSELKRTLRRGDTPANTVHRRGFDAPRDAHSTRMVNDRFRAASIYGFEMVDARARTNFHAIVRPSIENLRRIESFQFWENFRPLYLNRNTSDLFDGC